MDKNILFNMSDSDTDVLPNNVFTFHGQNTTVWAKGPNIRNTNVSNLSFRNNIMTSTMNMPWNLDRPRYAESVCDQRSYNRRETSPMSFHSASAMQPRNFHQTLYSRGNSQRSTYRSGSPMTIRTMDSNASMSAADIALAFKSANFNKYDLRIIKDAYNKFMKNRVRKRIEKRRNLRLFLKGGRRRSGYDSGEQGSNSSLSSDDCRSTRTSRTNYRDQASSCRSTKTDVMDFRRTIQNNAVYRDFTDSFTQSRYRNMFSAPPASKTSASQKENIQVNSQESNTKNLTQKERFKNGFLLPSERFNKSIVSLPIAEKPITLPNGIENEKQYTRTRYVLSQKNKMDRYNGTEANSEEEAIFSDNTVTEKTVQTAHNENNKRVFENEDDVYLPARKISKLSSPQKLNIKAKMPMSKQNNNVLSSNGNTDSAFVFAKPQCPIKKTTSVKNQNPLQNIPQVIEKSSQSRIKTMISKSSQEPVKKLDSKSMKQSSVKQVPKLSQQSEKSNQNQNPLEKQLTKSKEITKKIVIKSQTNGEKIKNPEQSEEKLISKSSKPVEQLVTISSTEQLISKSSQPLDTVDDIRAIRSSEQSNECQEKQLHDQSELVQHSNTDMSMRPSFIKRKLFTQKVDVAENKNASSDDIEANSSQSNIYSTIQKEKNRTRKLVTSQSCLNRDVLGDDSNLLDLIHKIVPPDRMNMTNKSELQYNKSKPPNTSKWDVSTILITNNNGDVSDSYTDEEIFKTHESNAKATSNKKKINSKPGTNPIKCTVLVEKLQVPNIQKSFKEMTNVPVSSVNNIGCRKRNIYDCVKSFWDTDVESDMENPKIPMNKSDLKIPLEKGAENQSNNEQVRTKQTIKKTTPVLEKTAPSTKTTSKLDKDKNNLRRQKLSQKTKDIPHQHTTPPSEPKLLKIQNIVQSTLKAKTVNQFEVKATQRTSKKSMPTNNNTTKRQIVETIQKINNNTLRIRSTRTPKIKKCCIEPSESEQSINESNKSLYRTLRNRVIDLSSSFKSDKSTPISKNVVTKHKRLTSSKVSKANPDSGTRAGEHSDISFTLTSASRKRVGSTLKKVTSKPKNQIGKSTK